MFEGRTKLFVVMLLLAGALPHAFSAEPQRVEAFVGEDLQLSGPAVVTFGSDSVQVLLFAEGFSMSIGADEFGADRAVVWLDSQPQGRFGEVLVRVFMRGAASNERSRAVRQPQMRLRRTESGLAQIAAFETTGQVFVTAATRAVADIRRDRLYIRGFGEVAMAEDGFAKEFESVAPTSSPPLAERPAGQPTEEPAAEPNEAKRPSFFERVFGVQKETPPEAPAGAKIRYPVNIAPAGETVPTIESQRGPDGNDMATIIGRFYLWQKQDERGGLLEMQADGAVVFYSSGEVEDEQRQGRLGQFVGGRAIQAVYLCGDVIMTYGRRTIRADEMYYDFRNSRGTAVNAVMRNFDVQRGIPVYVRAAKLRQLSQTAFSADDVTLTTSEFYVPQVSLGAAKMIITDTTVVDEATGALGDSSYDAQMYDVRLKLGESTIFGWPYMRSNLQRPDVPIKSMRVGHDGIWGTSAESRWHLSRLLGLEEPEGTDGTFELDYYSKRGVGTGMDVDYTREDHFGKMAGYIIDDRGADRLGRDSSRRDLKPPRELRGRFGWLHRHFMPYNWQVTTGINYESDENFVESYYRSEFNTGEPRETYIHTKRIEDNWGLSFLGKARINNFADELEQTPSADFHLTGESLFDDKFTFYSDSFAGRIRQQIGNEHTTQMTDEWSAFVAHRSELDMPLLYEGIKAVPYVAGTFGYDDRAGFTRRLVDGTNAGTFNEEVVFIGEAGVRLSKQYWKVYRSARSRLWDLDGLRHIIRPQLSAVYYGESDPVVKQHDVLNLGLSQRLQTRRGPEHNKRTVDWMRLDTSFTFVNDSESRDLAGPDRYIWNRPGTPLRIFSAPGIFNGDLADPLKRFELWGPKRNYFSTDYIWRVSDTTAVLSDLYYDMQSGVVEQLDIGFSRMRWPDLNYYVGSRYLRSIDIYDESGSNAFVFAATYELDPRYTVVFSQQYDFDYRANVESDVTLIRRYHRIYCGLTLSADASLDRQSIVFSIWPQGIPELAIGARCYSGLTGASGY